jgi:hypothetical protein
MRFNIVTCRVVRATKMTGSSSDDWNSLEVTGLTPVVSDCSFSVVRRGVATQLDSLEVTRLTPVVNDCSFCCKEEGLLLS